MARNYNTSVTSSINYLPFNLSASEGLTLNIDNPNQGSSYVVLETRRNSDGFYDENTPKDAQGTYTLTGVTNVVSDDYKAGFVIPPGGGTASFDNTNYVSGSDFRVVGTKYHPFYDTLLDRWPNAAAAYSLRRLNSYYEGPAVRVRRSIDDQETDIGFNPVELDTTTLESWVANPGTALPADYGDGPAAAYSLRYASSTYSGPVVRVRRDNDDAELDFTPFEITDGTLEAWVGSGNNGLVETWYDQSGNGNNASQTAAANQPKIVDSSTGLVLENEKPAIDFDGTDDFFNLTSNIVTNVNYTGFQVVKRNATLTNSVTAAGISINDSYLAWIFNDNKIYFRSSRGYIFTPLDINTQVLFTSLNIHTGNMTIYSNGSSIISSSPISLPSGNINTIGRRDADYGSGKTQELIFYPSDQSSNRTDIESNINNYYNIFPFDAYVETWYDQSGNGNHASQTTAANQPQIVSSGSGILENGKPALDFDGSNSWMNASSVNISTPQTYFTIAKKDVLTGGKRPLFDGLVSRTEAGISSFNLPLANFLGTTDFAKFGTPTTNQELQVSLFNGASSSIHVNSVSQGVGNVSLNSITNLGIGRDTDASDLLDGKYQELILYPSDQSSNRTGIETNINSHYKIY